MLQVEGTIQPEKDEKHSGDIEMIYTVARGGPAFREGGVADFIYLHGDTGQAPPVMPKLPTFLASWGTADVFVNGARVCAGLDGHMMYTERSRDAATRAIFNSDRSGFYNRKKPNDGSVADPGGREIHFVAHSMMKDTDNFPPHSVWIHLNFETVFDPATGVILGEGQRMVPGGALVKCPGCGRVHSIEEGLTEWEKAWEQGP